MFIIMDIYADLSVIENIEGDYFLTSLEGKQILNIRPHSRVWLPIKHDAVEESTHCIVLDPELYNRSRVIIWHATKDRFQEFMDKNYILLYNTQNIPVKIYDNERIGKSC